MDWLSTMKKELGKHEERMASMRAAALDEKAFEGVCGQLTDQGLTIVRAQASVVDGDVKPIAWILQATRES